MSLRYWVAVLRAYRLALVERAVVADRCGRRCCALTLASVRQDVTAAIEQLRHEEGVGGTRAGIEPASLPLSRPALGSLWLTQSVHHQRRLPTDSA